MRLFGKIDSALNRDDVLLWPPFNLVPSLTTAWNAKRAYYGGSQVLTVIGAESGYFPRVLSPYVKVNICRVLDGSSYFEVQMPPTRVNVKLGAEIFVINDDDTLTLKVVLNTEDDVSKPSIVELLPSTACLLLYNFEWVVLEHDVIVGEPLDVNSF